MMNFCLCGTQAYYPHGEYCPYPLYQATEEEAKKWLKALREKKERLRRQEETK